MNISEFFQHSAGKWVSQRTSHRVIQNQSEGAKADLMIEFLGATDPALIQLCQQQGFDPSAAAGLKITWSNGILESSPKPQSGSSLVIAVPDAVSDAGQPAQGQIISQLNSAQPTLGRYAIGADAVLTLTSQTNSCQTEERIWFAGDNFRLRTNVIKHAGSTHLASFCSEIRMGGKPPAEATETAEAAR